MAILIIGFILVAGAHFIYEGILLPSFRLYIRYQLYALRDKIRELKAKHGKEISDDAFKHLHEGINGTLRILPYIDMAFVKRFNRDYDNSPEIQKRVERRTQILDACKVIEVHQVKGKLIGLTMRTILINNGGWIIYLLPFMLVCSLIVLFVGLFKTCRDFFRKQVAKIVFSPEKTHQYIPAGYVIDSSAEFQFK